MGGKLKIEDIRKDIESKGWKLESTEYVNLKTDLELRCPKGHLNVVSYEKFRRGNYECPICQQEEFYVPTESCLKKSGYRILAFDQATEVSGWSVFDGNKLVKYGHWVSNSNDCVERIDITKQWFASMIKKWNPDKVVIEDIQLQTYKKNEQESAKMVYTFKVLANLQGVLMNYLFTNNIIHKVTPPSSWKSSCGVTGKNRSDQKRSAQLRVKALYNIDVTQDEADAILIGRDAVLESKSNEIIEFY